MDIHDVEADFAALTGRLHSARAAKARAYGNTPTGRRCLAAGLLLRAALGDDAVFETNAFGKPILADGRSFNLSHAGDYAVLATGDAPLGVDIERFHEVDYLSVANRFFHPDERAFLASQQDTQRAFFHIWTLKESYLKAIGRGFSVAPASFCVLPSENGASFSGETPYRFRRYDDTFTGYSLSVCAADPDFPGAATLLSVADIP